MEADGGRLLEAVLDNAPVGLAFFDRQHRAVRDNAAFRAIVGFDSGLIATDLDAVFDSSEPIVNREVTLGDGREWLLSHFPVNVDGTVVWVGTIATEITELRRVERERADLLAAERRARGAAERIAVRLARLQAVTARLTGEADADQVASVVCDHGAAGLGASAGALMLLTQGGAAFEMIRQTGYSASVTDEYRVFPADADLPACDAV